MIKIVKLTGRRIRRNDGRWFNKNWYYIMSNWWGYCYNWVILYNVLCSYTNMERIRGNDNRGKSNFTRAKKWV